MDDRRVEGRVEDSERSPSPGTNAAERRDWIRLCLVPGVGPVLRERLLARFGSPQKILQASPQALGQVEGVGRKTARAIQAARRLDVDALEAMCAQAGIELILQRDEAFPERLAEIPARPGLLFARGRMEPSDRLAVAIVGTRRPSSYGLRHARRLARGLAAQGVTIVSGLAEGIDGAAHEAALEQGGRTVAVLGSGHLKLYPASHRNLAARIAEAGCVLSEYPPEHPAFRSTFPQRNRVVSGLALATVVIEAGKRSGALITARHALEQNREVLVLPGPVDGGRFSGAHALLADGARAVESTDDILDAIGPLPAPVPVGSGDVHHGAELLLSERERAVLDQIGRDPTPIDQVVAASGLGVSQVLSVLSILEMRSVIRRVSGQFVARI